MTANTTEEQISKVVPQPRREGTVPGTQVEGEKLIAERLDAR